ncbi:MAG: hypothetical protein IKK71_01110 [Clostridia bacterium]|nr:hypothetical protein [Clostridia bacterium]
MKIPNLLKLNNALGNPIDLLKHLRKKLVVRIALLVVVIVLTLVLVFAQTVAWQTNVVHTGGLMFTADTWNFSVDGSLISKTTPAAPGDTAIIGLEISNQSDNLAAASVKVSKADIIETMRHRMFFYVDTTAVRNGETVDRVYINEKNSYTYTLFPYNVLELKDNNATSPLIKWEWTYDNLGYYVYGKKTDDNKIEVEEYLRPIEYEFDFMRTTFSADGKLKTIDGKTTATTFLENFSKTDGYDGQIDKNEITADGYYTVTYDKDTGYGVFAYLCTLAEINEGSKQDTTLGTDNAEIGEAKLQLMGQNCRTDGVLVTDEASLKEALSTPGLNMVTLAKDISLSSSITASDSSQVIVDLAGHKITSTANQVVTANDGGSVMLCNGEIDAKGNNGIYASAGNVTFKDITLKNAYEGVLVYDNKSAINGDSVICLSGCKIEADEDGLLIYGNGSASTTNTKIVIEDSDILGRGYSGIICNGSYYGMDISITNSTVKGHYTAIYFPSKDSSLSIKGSTLEGYTGLVAKGGTVDIVDCSITGTGAFTELPDPSKLSGSGWVDTGDGVYLEANYDWPCSITISGENTKITSTQENTLAVRMYPDDKATDSIEISGGTFSSDVSAFVKSGYVQDVSTTEFIVKKAE